MKKGLETLSREDLLVLLADQKQVIESLQHTYEQALQEKQKVLVEQAQQLNSHLQTIQAKDRQLAQKDARLRDTLFELDKLKKKIFGPSSERFVKLEGQLDLPFVKALSEEEQKKQEEKFEQQIQAHKRKLKKSNHKGRLALSEDLEVEEIEIHPAGDLSQMVCIGKEVTDELAYQPEKFYIKRYTRYKYIAKSKEGKVEVGELPTRPIEKGKAGASVLAMLLVNKYVDHLPIYRQQKRFAREGIQLARSTLEGWVKQASELLEPLYECLIDHIKSQGYLQVDETPIAVLDKTKKGKTHRGYYWVYYSPITQTILFDYQKGRAKYAPAKILDDFQGYLQTDGYAVYESYAQKEGITQLACLAHARRKFVEAQKNDGKRAEQALQFIQQLYQIEKEAKDNKLNPQQRFELRKQKVNPILEQYIEWLFQQLIQQKIIPDSPIHKAIQYTTQRWTPLINYLKDGHLEIDNNPIENAIRPLAIGRKNYLFAGSHQAAQRAAIIYSFFGTCYKHHLNPYQWLKVVLENIHTIKAKQIQKLLPQNFEQYLKEIEQAKK